ncbi:MAG: DNA cytosine methyltransferase [Ignavibacteriae bacterium]|nr:DNA cytosine methyltransferase [Ignavibacteriota bacterium]
MKPTVIDLFCGCGGLSYGFMKAGYDIVVGIDNWKDAIETFNYNHTKNVGKVIDLFNAKPDELGIKNNIDVIIGGPPCQGYSIAGKRIIEDERNELYKSFVKFVDHYKPKAFLMENVPNIISMGKGAVREQIIKDLETLGYKVVYKILMASDYGVPQNRRRAFFVGLKNGKEFEFPEHLVIDKVTSEEAISDLTEDSILDGTAYPFPPKSKFQTKIRNGNKVVFNHEITNHKEQTVEIISMVPDGGNYKDLPKELHQTRKVNIAWTRLNSQKPSFTIDTGHRHHFHYEYNRVPTVRESARIQSFPDSFVFKGSKTSQYKQVGNAVPPMLAEHLAKKLLKEL